MRESIHSNTSPNTMLLVCHNGLFNDEFPFNKKIHSLMYILLNIAGAGMPTW